MDIDKANAKATERMMEARPVVIGMEKALDVIPGMRENLLLHAGPPITWERASGPMRGAITGALIFEGKAQDEAEAQARRGVRLRDAEGEDERAPRGPRLLGEPDLLAGSGGAQRQLHPRDRHRDREEG